jgi:hypothetical protein
MEYPLKLGKNAELVADAVVLELALWLVGVGVPEVGGGVKLDDIWVFANVAKRRTRHSSHSERAVMAKTSDKQW